MRAAQLLSLVQIVSINIWGLPDAGFKVLSPLREERVSALCSRLKLEAAKPQGWDVILLQEAWVKKDREALSQCGYGATDLNDPSRPLDSGLMILSRYPVSQAKPIPFFQAGDPSKALEDGEAFARKGVLLARVEHPQRAFWVGDTHLISIYDPKNDTYAKDRRIQFEQYASWAMNAAGSEPLILGGDWNFGPGTPLWPSVPSVLPGFTQAPGAESQCTLCPPNFMHVANEGKLDHLFASPGVQAVSGQVVLDEPLQISGAEFNYSDHFGWETTFGLPE